MNHSNLSTKWFCSVFVIIMCLIAISPFSHYLYTHWTDKSQHSELWPQQKQPCSLLAFFYDISFSPPSVSLCRALINLVSEKKEHKPTGCGAVQ